MKSVAIYRRLCRDESLLLCPHGRTVAIRNSTVLFKKTEVPIHPSLPVLPVKTLFCLLSLLFLTGRFPVWGSGKELKLQSVVLKPLSTEKSIIPDFERHSYDIQDPTIDADPYLPEFKLRDPALPEGFSVNIELDGGLFRGDEGVIASGITALAKREYALAGKKFRSILDKSGEFKDLATLWMARLAFAQSRFKDSAQYFSKLHGAEHIELRREAVYFSSLILLKTGKQDRSAHFLRDIGPHLKRDDWDIRIGYAYLVSLALLERWQEAEKFLEDFEGRSISHSDRYYKIKEIGGLIHHALGNYDRSRRYFADAGRYYPLPDYRFARSRNIAWIHYATGNYDRALAVLDEELRNYRGRHRDELQYLRISCLARKEEWKEAEAAFGGLSPKSTFYIPSAYQIRTRLKGHKEFGELHGRVMGEKYNFPSMKFNVALLNGNYFLRKNDPASAEREYLHALSVKTADPNRWIGQYNLGLTYLKSGNFREAERRFQTGLGNLPEQRRPWSHYHLLYSLFRQGEYRRYLKLESEDSADGLKRELRSEIRFMKAISLLHTGREEEAIDEFLYVWRAEKSMPAFVAAVKTLYKNRRFRQLVRLVEQYPEAETDLLFGYRIKSLLASRQSSKALEEIENRKLTGDRLIALRLEVWFANKRYDKVIAEVSPLLKHTESAEKRRLYYASLGDSYFNLQKYVKSKNQYYRALELADGPKERSPILYNIVLATYLYRDYASFEKEIDRTLKREELLPDTRFRLTDLLTDHYIRNGRIESADSVLESYLQRFPHRKTELCNKRITLHYDSGNYGKCFSLAQSPVEGETEFQRRDRTILAGYCGRSQEESLAAIDLIQNERTKESREYRRAELDFVLSLAYSNVGQFSKSNELLESGKKSRRTKRQILESDLLMAGNSLRLESPDEAERALGDVNRYRENQKYVPALYLKAEIKKAQKDYHRAVGTLLRIYYRPETSPLERQRILLAIAELYQEAGTSDKAASYFGEIDYKSIANSTSLSNRYAKLKAALQNRTD